MQVPSEVPAGTEPSFGQYIRLRRETLAQTDRQYSLRKIAQRLGIEPAYLSKIERDVFPPPSEIVITQLAKELGEDPDVLLAMAGKLSQDLRAIILRRPKVFADLIRQLREVPEHAILKIVREVRDGIW